MGRKVAGSSPAAAPILSQAEISTSSRAWTATQAVHVQDQAMLIGYAFLGHSDGDRQIDELKRAGCRRLFTHYGDEPDLMRPQAIDALAALEPRDVLVVWRFECLVGRSLPRLLNLADQLRARAASSAHCRKASTQAVPRAGSGSTGAHRRAGLAIRLGLEAPCSHFGLEAPCLVHVRTRGNGSKRRARCRGS